MKKINFACKILLIIIVISQITFAQTQNNLDFFPHHVGDIWQYSSSPDGEFYELKITRIDTSNDKKWNLLFFNNKSFATWKINLDSALVYEYLVDQEEWFLDFKLNAPEGDWWLRYNNNVWAQYAGPITEERWNQILRLKKYYQYDIIPPDTIPPFTGYVEFLAEGIGYYGSSWEGGNEELLGCIIDGVKYGTIVSVNDDANNVSINEYFLNNYPNPFNNQTTLSYWLPKETYVSIKIYDILGREVETIVSNYKRSGKYIAKWYPENMTSGIYIAVLSTNTKQLIIKLQYIK